MFWMLEEKPWFYYQSFFKDYYIHSMPFWDEKLQLLCSRSHRSEFQDIVLHIYLLSVEVFFCLWLMIKHFLLSFHSAELVGNFVFCSLEVSLRIISFRCPFWSPCLKFWLPDGKLQTPLHPGCLLGSSLAGRSYILTDTEIVLIRVMSSAI